MLATKNKQYQKITNKMWHNAMQAETMQEVDNIIRKAKRKMKQLYPKKIAKN